MKTFLADFHQKYSWKGWVFILILASGIILRTNHFHDWLRFNADQSRDATIVSSVIDGQTPLPLLGPKAGGTNFRLGPMFYYLQIGAAKIFGNTPDKMAYPDLFSSILAIPLLFFFLRKYFDTRTALALMAVFAVSAYAVKYSRFAWNPNSLPFWSMLYLYALHEIAIAQEKLKKVWVISAGVALGIGVQLHTLALILFPVVGIGVFGYLLYEKKRIWKAAVAILLLALFLNAGQIASEVQTGGSNTKAFFSGVGTKEKKGNGMAGNLKKDIVCFVGGNDYILSSYDASDTCEIRGVTRGYNGVIFFAGLIFFIGGIVLAVRAYRREEVIEKRYFLGIFILYFGAYFLLLVPLANEISMRFFLGIIFMPFVFFGLWKDYVTEKYSRYGEYAVLGVSALFIITNMVSVGRSFSTYVSYLEPTSIAGMDNVLLQEVERSAGFVVAYAGGAQTVVVDGDAAYFFKALKSMQYFTNQSGTKLVRENKITNPNIPSFLIDNTKRMKKILENNPNITEYESFGRFTIFKE